MVAMYSYEYPHGKTLFENPLWVLFRVVDLIDSGFDIYLSVSKNSATRQNMGMQDELKFLVYLPLQDELGRCAWATNS